MNTFTLYSTWNRVLGQWLSHVYRTRRVNLIWLIVGLYLGGSVKASAIVKHWRIPVKVTSLTRRLSRFLDNSAIRPAVWYRPVARRLLEHWRGQTVTLIIDATKVGAGHQLVMVALAYRHRALPIAWSWVKGSQGQGPAALQQAVLQRVQHLMPSDVSVMLIGDSAFGSVALMQHLQTWGWTYVVRQTGRHLVRPTATARWIRFDEVVQRGGPRVWWPQAHFTQKWDYGTNLCASWAPTESTPWLLTSNLADAHSVCHAYAKRMWIEEMFGDLKRHGWDLEITHLRHPDRLSRLTFAVCLLYVWLVFYGQRVIKAGWRPLVDRAERRDLSVFRIGLDILQRCFALDMRPPVPLPKEIWASVR